MDFYSLLSDGSRAPLDLKMISDCYLNQPTFSQNRLILPYPQYYNKPQEGSLISKPEENTTFLAETSLKVFHSSEKLNKLKTAESNPWKKVKLGPQDEISGQGQADYNLIGELNRLPKISSPVSSESKLKDQRKNQKKYQIYSEDEKNSILQFFFNNDIKTTIEKFSTPNRKLTKRKLRCWAESCQRVKEVKGRKLDDPILDKQFYEWCLEFQKQNKKAPNSREGKRKALEMSQDPNFKASKGWLRRFTIRHNFHFTPMKTFRNKPKKNKFTANKPEEKVLDTQSELLSEIGVFIKPDESSSRVPEVPKLFEVEEQPKEITLEPQWNIIPKEEQENFTLYSFLNFSSAEKPNETERDTKSHLMLCNS